MGWSPLSLRTVGPRALPSRAGDPAEPLDNEALADDPAAGRVDDGPRNDGPRNDGPPATAPGPAPTPTAMAGADAPSGPARRAARALVSDRGEAMLGAPQGSWGRLVERITDFERAHPLAADALLAAGTAVLTAAWLLRSSQQLHASPLAWGLEAGLIIPLIWRRRQPQLVLAVLAVVAAVQWAAGILLTADISLLIALYTLAAHRARLVALAGAALLEVGAMMATTRWSLAGDWFRSFVFISGLVAAALFLGANLQSRRANMEAWRDRAAQLERERDQHARLAAAAERTRIAREMHDVIAHSLAVMVTMADGASAKLRRDPDQAAAAIDRVSDVGREALRETRRLVGVLRDDSRDDSRDGTSDGAWDRRGPAGTDAPVDDRSPQPGLDQLPELVDKLAATGIRADLSVEGVPFALPAGAQLAAYRIVQEATTNTLKHGVGATELRVRLCYDAPDVEVEVRDNGRAPSPRPAAEREAGHGLSGMRERVALYNGRVAAGPDPDGDGGWLVRARLRAGGGGSASGGSAAAGPAAG